MTLAHTRIDKLISREERNTASALHAIATDTSLETPFNERLKALCDLAGYAKRLLSVLDRLEKEVEGNQ